MINIMDIILLKYPGIQGVTYWQTKYDGSAWADPYQGLLWDNKDIPKPTKTVLQQWAVEVDLKYRQRQAREARVYPSVQDQLEMIYKDKINNTTTWVDALTAVRLTNPIPEL